MTEVIDVSSSDTYAVKNTFIDLRQYNHGAKRRNKSLPPSFSPTAFVTCSGLPRGNCASPDKFVTFGDSDDSTDMRTEASDDAPSSDLGNLSAYAASSTYDYAGVCEPCGGMAYPSPEWIQNTIQNPDMWSQAPVPWTSSDAPRYQKLSSKATAFQPSTQLSSGAVAFRPSQQPMMKGTIEQNQEVGEMIKAAKAVILERGRNIGNVDVVQGAEGWSLVITPDRKSTAQVEGLLELAKDSLLIAAERSKNVYVMAYMVKEVAFTPKPQGFAAQLGLLKGECSYGPCWRALKRADCGHTAHCYKEHPAIEVPVEVFVEMTYLNAAVPMVTHFKQEAANIMMMVTAMLTSAACGAGAQVITDEEKGWSIEVYVRDEELYLKDHILTHAKNAFTEAVQHSKTVYILGSGAAPFITKSNGFTTTFALMSDRTQACWDIYMQGACWRQHSCRWQHPECIMPINVTLKTVSDQYDQ